MLKQALVHLECNYNFYLDSVLCQGHNQQIYNFLPNNTDQLNKLGYRYLGRFLSLMMSLDLDLVLTAVGLDILIQDKIEYHCQALYRVHRNTFYTGNI